MNKEHLTFSELRDKIREHNEANNIKHQFEDKNPLQCVIVYTEDSFKEHYPLESRSYMVASDNKYFLPNMMGSSLFGYSLDGTDSDVRLDYAYDWGWKIDYCYILNEEEANLTQLHQYYYEVTTEYQKDKLLDDYGVDSLDELSQVGQGQYSNYKHLGWYRAKGDFGNLLADKGLELVEKVKTPSGEEMFCITVGGKLEKVKIEDIVGKN